jgi:hypothetical protein
MRALCPPLLGLWEQAAGGRLRDAFGQVSGGLPGGAAARPLWTPRDCRAGWPRGLFGAMRVLAA